MNLDLLKDLNIPTDSTVGAVQKVGELVREAKEPSVKAVEIISMVVGIGADQLQNATLQDDKKSVVVAQHVVESAVKGEDVSEATVTAGIDRAEKMAASPSYSFAFVKSEPKEVDQSGTVVATIGEQEVRVERKSNGKIKKGGKQVLAKALFEANKTATTAELVAIFVKDLGMTKAGATTYVYNQRKAAGLTSNKKGRKPGSKVAKAPKPAVEKKPRGRNKEADAQAKAAKADAKAAKKAEKVAATAAPAAPKRQRVKKDGTVVAAPAGVTPDVAPAAPAATE